MSVAYSEQSRNPGRQQKTKTMVSITCSRHYSLSSSPINHFISGRFPPSVIHQARPLVWLIELTTSPHHSPKMLCTIVIVTAKHRPENKIPNVWGGIWTTTKTRATFTSSHFPLIARRPPRAEVSRAPAQWRCWRAPPICWDQHAPRQMFGDRRDCWFGEGMPSRLALHDNVINVQSRKGGEQKGCSFP